MGKIGRLVWVWRILLFGGIVLLGCRQPQPPQVVEVLTVEATAMATAVTRAADPTVAAILAQITPTATSTLSPAATPTAGQFVCPTPPGWLTYVVQANDTLYSLAARTGTAVDALKAANCLLDDILIVGDLIYLPTLPPTPPPPVYLPLQPPTISTTTPVCSPFGCPQSTLLAFSLPAGSPNEGLPCLIEGERIEAKPDPRTQGVRERGENIDFFACGFADPSSLTATIQGPHGIEFLTPQPAQKIPDFRGKPDIPYINWGVKCDLPDGTYTVTFNSEQGQSITSTFRLADPSFRRILTVPSFGPPGTVFDVYYCGFSSPGVSQEGEDVRLFYALDRTETDEGYTYDWALSITRTINVNEQGWAVDTLTSLPHDPPRGYLLLDQTEIGFRPFWLVNP